MQSRDHAGLAYKLQRFPTISNIKAIMEVVLSLRAALAVLLFEFDH